MFNNSITSFPELCELLSSENEIISSSKLRYVVPYSPEKYNYTAQRNDQFSVSCWSAEILSFRLLRDSDLPNMDAFTVYGTDSTKITQISRCLKRTYDYCSIACQRRRRAQIQHNKIIR